MSTKSDTDTVALYLGVFLVPLMLAMLLPVTLWFGWATSALWGWFVVPIFGLPALSISQAAGLALVAACFRAKLSAPKDESGFALKVVTVILGPPVAVGMGWLIKWTAL